MASTMAPSLHVRGTELVEAVSSRPSAFRPARGPDGQVGEVKLPTRFLGR
jgi:hypothetical protein